MGQEETHASVLTHRPDGGGARSIAVNPCFQVPVVVEGHLGVIGNSQKTQVEGKAKGKNCTEEHRRTKMSKKRRTRGADRRQVRTCMKKARRFGSGSSKTATTCAIFDNCRHLKMSGWLYVKSVLVIQCFPGSRDLHDVGVPQPTKESSFAHACDHSGFTIQHVLLDGKCFFVLCLTEHRAIYAVPAVCH